MPTHDTLWILGDQLDADHPGLRGAEPSRVRILMIESEALLRAQRWHIQRVHLVLAAMRRYADALRERGFTVDYRHAKSFAAALDAHRKQHKPARVLAAEPMSHGLHDFMRAQDIELLEHSRFLLHYRDFQRWAKRQRQLRMDAFYRERRRATRYLMDGQTPAGGSFSFDTENRETAAHAPRTWPEPVRDALDELDERVLHDLKALGVETFGREPDGTWATTQRGARRRLRHFIAHVLPRFGPHQDVMLHDTWHLAHSLLSPYLNLGLLHPREVCDAVEKAYRAGHVPLASAEGFLRQVLGWREYIWGTYWHFGPQYAHSNALGAKHALLPLYREPERTQMQCVRDALSSIEEHAYAHHIQRLMVLGNLALLTGVRPLELSRYMQVSFIDGGEWVMWPNVLGMGLFADGGRMSTKPYAAGGAYIKRMSDACTRCSYRPSERVGERACPFTSLYWAFYARHREQFAGHPRVQNIVRGLDRLRDREATLEHAERVLDGLLHGRV